MPVQLTHQELEGLVAGLATGGLDEAEREQAARHVAECASCQASYAAYREIWLSLGAAAPRVLPPPQLRVRVLRAVTPREKPVVHEQQVAREQIAARPERRAAPGGFDLISRILDAFRPAHPALAPRRARIAVAIVLALLLPLGAIFGVGLFAPSPAIAASTTLTIVGGTVEVAGPDGVFAIAEDGMLLTAGQRVRTSDDASAIVTFFDGSTLTIEGGTDVLLETILADAGDGATAIVFFQAIGRTWSNVQKLVNPRSRYEVRTPSATAAVRGTLFATSVERTDAGIVLTRVDIDLGAVELATPIGRVLVERDQTSQAVQDQKPSEPKKETPKEQIHVDSNAPILLVQGGKACGRTIEGGVVQVVQQLPRCVVTESGVTVKGAKPGELQIVVKSEREQDVTLRAVGVIDGVEAFRHETTQRVKDLVIARLTTERKPDGSLEVKPPTEFRPTDRSPARIGKPKKSDERGTAGPAGQQPRSPERQRQQPRPGEQPKPGEQPRTGEQPKPGTGPASDKDRDTDRRPDAKEAELPRDVERALDPEGTRGRALPGDGREREPKKDESKKDEPKKDEPQQGDRGRDGLPRPSLELPRPPAPGTSPKREETRPDKPGEPPKTEEKKPEPPKQGSPKQEPPKREEPKPQQVPQPRLPQLPQPGSGPGGSGPGSGSGPGGSGPGGSGPGR